jgi:ribosomal protein RSM22 (predicted rRNA methylase)
MIDFEKIIRDSAVKNKLVVHKDDPVMVLATIINTMLDDLTASLAAALDKYQSGNNDIARRWRLDAEAGAAKVLNAALDAGREATAKTMSEGANKVTALIQAELVTAVLHQRRELDMVVAGMRRHSFLMLGAYGAMLIGAVIVSLL